MNRADCRKVVVNVVFAGDFYISLAQNRLVVKVNFAPVKIRAVFGTLVERKFYNLARRLVFKRVGDFVFHIYNKFAVNILMRENVLFRVCVFLHILVIIKMIGRNVRYNRDVGAVHHTLKLKA